MKATRRYFLQSSAAAVTVSFLTPSLLARVPRTNDVGARRVLVILQLAGGNDGINTFIPYTDALYRSTRPTLAIPDAQILKIDDRMGLHPMMTGLVPLYQQGKFSFVNNVGFATLDRSHFRCQDVWQTGDDSYGQTQRGIRGWVGRYADLYLGGEDSSLTSLAIGNKVPLGLEASNVSAAVVENADAFGIQTNSRAPEDRDAFIATLRGIYESSQQSGALSLIGTSGAEMFRTIDLLATIVPPSATAVYPETPLGRGMQLIAQTIASDVGTRVAWISLAGFDTHSSQAADHDRLLADVSSSLAAFQQDVDERGLGNDVLVLGWSEFGRRVQENASLGTDHGKAGTVFLLSGALRGGTFYGDVPDLRDLDAGDLRTEIDFRAVYATVIRDFLGHDPEPVLNGSYENLGFIEPAGVRRRRTVRT